MNNDVSGTSNEETFTSTLSRTSATNERNAVNDVSLVTNEERLSTPQRVAQREFVTQVSAQGSTERMQPQTSVEHCCDCYNFIHGMGDWNPMRM